PTGSPAHVEGTRHSDLLNEYVPRLVMSSPDEFEAIWKEYVQRTRPYMQLRLEYIQEQLEWRVKNWTPDN
ncbi:MAG: sugar ABC transporter substrate-binding protein, partial [Halanaerobiaceae bacterium]|nr:sugar ABC transporter substrate-binding protein [Halanaerobiaceae bacterium]